MDSLPQGPQWHCTKIKMDEYITVHPVYLLWRDAFEVAEMIFGNLIFCHDVSRPPRSIH
ncbi:hypothetical protein JVU11DRAFT_6041 [Chiua virens]|nr:hypothetical protein JVU11DRAFT_6041 [Chiua virens]